jgi:gas vesicle protein
MSDRVTDFVKGLLIGGAIGVIAGIFLAPKSGRETREDFARKADELKQRAMAEYEQAREKGRQAYDAAAKKLHAMKEKAEEGTDAASQPSEEAKTTS